MSSAYYRRIYEKFNRGDQTSLQTPSNQYETNSTASVLMPPPPNINSDPSTKVNHKKKRREHKYELKNKENCIQNYIETKKHIAEITKKSYIHILQDFRIFSPNLEPAHISDYLNFKFKIAENEFVDKTTINGNATKYFNCLKQYFKSRGVEIESNFKPLYYPKPKGKSDQAFTIVTLNEIREAYTTLASKGKYQDSIIIHFIYSLSIDPYHIFGIRYEDILSQSQIQWWDYKTSSFKTGFLYYELWSDINFLQKMKEKVNPSNRCTVRTMLDLKKIKGNFIIDASPTNIYNKFKRHFSDIVPSFNCTPKDILKLSLINAHNNTGKRYNRALLGEINIAKFIAINKNKMDS